MARRERHGKEQKKSDSVDGLEQINRNAGGIDVGSSFHMVKVPSDRAAEPVQRFESYTADLHRLAGWLKECKVDTVAMESTGDYWVGLYEVLESHGIRVFLVDARTVKHVPGRKSDVKDCQWLQQLLTFGLLNRCFIPDDEIRVLKRILHHRQVLVAEAGSCLQRMQKSMVEMNVQLANTISDVSGLTGMKIIKAIVDGERNPETLAAMADVRIRASQEEIARSLEGNWRDELIYVIADNLELYELYRSKIEVSDQKFQTALKNLNPKAEGDPEKEVTPSGKGRRKAANFTMQKELYRVAGTDLTRIPGIDVGVAQTLIATVGLDMTRFPSEKHFVSLVGLCPNHKISGGKVLRRKSRKVSHPAATALRIAAISLKANKTALGAKFRRLRSRIGSPKAITAMARTLGTLVYRMLKHGEEYVEAGMRQYEERIRQQDLGWLAKKAAEFNFGLVQLS